MKKETWVIVANSSLARFFKLEGLKMTELDSLIHPQAHLPDHDLVTDRSGQSQDRFGGGRSTYEPHHTPKETENQNFAKKISDVLDNARRKGTLGKIYLSASPQILGLLRNEFDNHVTDMIESELDKDLSHLKPQEIIKYFPIGI